MRFGTGGPAGCAVICAQVMMVSRRGSPPIRDHTSMHDNPLLFPWPLARQSVCAQKLLAQPGPGPTLPSIFPHSIPPVKSLVSAISFPLDLFSKKSLVPLQVLILG